MKEEEIKIRISEEDKKDFQIICESETITMSNKIITFIKKEINLKKIKITDRVITKKLILLDLIHKNGRIYPKNEFTRIRLDEDGLEYTELERLNKKILYGQFGYPENAEIIHKYNATHSVSNLRIQDEWIIGDVTILNDSILPILDKLNFRPRSTGWVKDNGVVYDVDVIGFDAVLKTEDDFIE